MNGYGAKSRTLELYHVGFRQSFSSEYTFLDMTDIPAYYAWLLHTFAVETSMSCPSYFTEPRTVIMQVAAAYVAYAE